MKLHRDAVFGPETVQRLRHSSILITMLAAQSYKPRALAPDFSELDLLLDIIRTVPSFITPRSAGVGRTEWVWTTRQRTETISPVPWTVSGNSKRLVSGTGNYTRTC